MAENIGIESLLTETEYNNSKHDKIVRKIDGRLKRTGLYDTVMHNAQYFYNSGHQASDADNIAINHKLKKIIYIEDKSSAKLYLIKKGTEQIYKAKQYFENMIESKGYKFYGFLALGRGKRYELHRVL